MFDWFFAGMQPGAVAIVGALMASVAWMALTFWLLDRLDTERRRVAAWHAEARWLTTRKDTSTPKAIASPRLAGGRDAA